MPGAGMLRFGTFSAAATIMHRVAVNVAAGQIVVHSSGVVAKVVFATQTGQGQDELKDEDRCAHRGTDHEDLGHGYLLPNRLQLPVVFRPPPQLIGRYPLY